LDFSLTLFFLIGNFIGLGLRKFLRFWKVIGIGEEPIKEGFLIPWEEFFHFLIPNQELPPNLVGSGWNWVTFLDRKHFFSIFYGWI